MQRRLPAAVAAVMLASAPGCTRGADAGDVAAFVRLFDGYSAEYDNVDEPIRLARMSAVVVRGSIDAVRPGPVYPQFPGDPQGARSVVLAVRVRAVLHGTLPDPGHRSVYVQLPAPGGTAAEVFDRHAPKEATVVLYLVPSREGGALVTNPDAGRPAGQRLVEPTTPQGFVVEAPGGVVEPTGHRTFPAAAIDAFVPSAAVFPSPAPAEHHP